MPGDADPHRRVVVIGEAMFEYLAQASGPDSLRYGGDTLNTAMHMARLGRDVAYVTAVGDDPLSMAMVSDWQANGLDTQHVLRHPIRQPGIYAIHTDATGERSFLYWRDQSAAREMFALPGMAAAKDLISDADLLYFSHITLAVLPAQARGALLDLARQVRARGGDVAYDSNFRPRLWASADEARAWSDQAVAIATIGLPTADDERAMHASSESDEAVAERWHAQGCREVAVKCGAAGCVVKAQYAVWRQPCTPQPMIDSSGAGDAFNAGYLAARTSGASPRDAATRAQTLASWVIGLPGALPPPDSTAPYELLAR